MNLCQKISEDILASKKIVVVPDVLANGGGVTVSYYEWVQNRCGDYWTEAEVAAKQDASMIKAFENVWFNAKQYLEIGFIDEVC